METRTSPGPRSLLSRFAHLGADPADPPEEGLRKQTLVLSAGVITALAVVWVVSYWAMGLHLSAVIPFAYQVISIVNLVIFARTRRYRFFRACELGLSLLLPFALQLSLGGFVPSSGVILWSFTAPLGALLFAGRREAVRWFAAFIVVIALAGALDPLLANKTAEIPPWVNITFFVLNVLGVTGTCYFLLHFFVGERDRAAAEVAYQRERSERLNGIQTWNVAPGGGAMFELSISDEGLYPFVTHSFAYTGLGSVGVIKVDGSLDAAPASYPRLGDPFTAGVTEATGAGPAAGDGGGEWDGGSSDGPVEIAAAISGFDPSSFDVKENDGKVTLTIENLDAFPHDFTVDDLGVKLEFGASETNDYTIEASPGSYTFYCSIPGHREAGMEGSMTVLPGTAH